MSIDPDPYVVAEIQRKLDATIKEYGVRILFAVESGSRAWGFPSPDSDYDVRFVYVHEPDWYLSLKPGRDVIELPLDETYDINGWDIRKALNLSLKSNPVMLEWLTSPMHYRREPVAHVLAEFVRSAARPQSYLHHYYRLWQRGWESSISDENAVKVKKYLNFIRPVLALEYLRQCPDTLPPMNVHKIMEAIDMPRTTVDSIRDLIIAKRDMVEAELTGRKAEIDDWVKDVTNWADGARFETPPAPEQSIRAQSLFREIVKGEL